MRSQKVDYLIENMGKAKIEDTKGSYKFLVVVLLIIIIGIILSLL